MGIKCERQAIQRVVCPFRLCAAAFGYSISFSASSCVSPCAIHPFFDMRFSFVIAGVPYFLSPHGNRLCGLADAVCRGNNVVSDSLIRIKENVIEESFFRVYKVQFTRNYTQTVRETGC